MGPMAICQAELTSQDHEINPKTATSRPACPFSHPFLHTQLTPRSCFCAFARVGSPAAGAATPEAKFKDHLLSQRSHTGPGSNLSSPTSWLGDLVFAHLFKRAVGVTK